MTATNDNPLDQPRHIGDWFDDAEYAAECAADDAAAEAAIVHDQAETAARRGAGLPEPEPTTDAF